MKHVWKCLVAAALAMALLLSVTAAAAESVYGVCLGDTVKVRKQPTTSAAVWFYIDRGFVAEILDVTGSGDNMWYKVNAPHPEPNGHTYIGYVHADYFRPMTEEETAEYLAGQGVVPDADVQTGAPDTVTATPTIRPSADSALGGSFNVGIMTGVTATPTSAPTNTPGYLPGDEEDDYSSVGTQGTVGTIVEGATGMITASGVNFRMSPSLQGQQIGRLNNGTVVELLEIPASVGADYWYRIRYNGQEGYVQSNYIRVLTVGYTPSPEITEYGWAELLYDSVNLRKTPGGTTMAQWTGKGSLLQIAGPSERKSGYEWYPVYYGAQRKVYYVREDMIKIVNAAAPTSTPVGESPYGYVITTVSGVNLRLKPGGETIDQIPRGTVVPCIGYPVMPEGSSYTWFYVEYKGLRGYLRGDCVKICTAEGGDIVEITPTPAPTGSTTVYGYIKLTANRVNIRIKPGGTSLGQLPEDLILPIVGATITVGKYDWYNVRTADGIVGYIRSDCLMVCDENGDKVTVTPTPAPTAGTPTLSTYGYVQIDATSVNLRDSVDGETIHQLRKGTVWPMIGLAVTYKQYTWYPIKAEGYTGFVRGDVAFKLSPSQELAYLQGLGVPTETRTPNPGTALSSYLITTGNKVNLREAASLDSAAPYQVAKGTVMPFSGTKQVGTKTWYNVVYEGRELWIRGDYIRVMTQAEYQAWLGEEGGEEITGQGFVRFIKSGVNVRNAANGSKVVDRMTKGTVVPYFKEGITAGGYSWYYILTTNNIYGYVRSDMVEKCDENGNDLPLPTPVPGGSTTGGTQQEASYTTLKLGSSGNAVKNLVIELKNQGYYTGAITSSFTSEVQRAVMAFQAANGLTVDGIAGSATQHKLFGTVPIGSGDHQNLTFEFYPVEKIDWFTGGIQQLWAKGANYKIYDIKTGIVWWAHRWSGAYHADIEPLTAADTARLCQMYGVKDAQDIYDQNLWQRRPSLVTIGTRTFACSLDGMPHNPDGDTIPNNNMVGQICLHFTNSKGHESGAVSSSHRAAIEEAFAWAKARYGSR